MYSISEFSHQNNQHSGRSLEEGRESQNPQTEIVNYNRQIPISLLQFNPHCS